MAKKKTTKQAPPLSPEKYIRLKSRNLPIYSCWINRDWRKSRSADIIVTRQHMNGNLTICTYLVDLGCLGVKDTQYIFNTRLDQFKSMISTFPGQLVDAPYKLVHNIILSAIKYAAKYEFAPHKVFTQTTAFFLEDDDKKIPRRSIPCGGENGKPLYINSGYESPAQVKEILKQLARTAGLGNYEYIESLDDERDFNDDVLDEDDFEEYFDEDAEAPNLSEIAALERLEQYKMFVSTLAHQVMGKGKAFDNIRLDFLSKLIIESILDKEELDKRTETVRKHLTYPTVEITDLPNSLFTGIPNNPRSAVRYNELFSMTMTKNMKKKKVEEAWNEFREEWGETPIVYYTRLLFLERTKSPTYDDMVEEFHEKYPDYLPITMKWYFNKLGRQLMTKEEVEACSVLLSTAKERITHHEFEVFLALYSAMSIDVNDSISAKEAILRTAAFERYLLCAKEEIVERRREELINILLPIKRMRIAEYLIKNGMITVPNVNLNVNPDE
ncbi:MAG: hypothetical protein LBQ65_05910 [Tannerellaceae bacterium]|jgi:hypothetical protein|nr:hypothetical protein [Tannerellaceae bacterium]